MRRSLWLLVLCVAIVSGTRANNDDEGEDDGDTASLHFLPPRANDAAQALRSHKARSNAMNPNNRAYNPTAQPRGSGTAAKASSARDAKANKVIQGETPGYGSAAANGAVFGAVTAATKKLKKVADGESLDKGDAADVATSAFVGGVVSTLITKVPAAGPILVVGGTVYEMTNCEGVKCVAESAAKTVGCIGAMVTAGSVLPGLGNIAGAMVGAFTCADYPSHQRWSPASHPSRQASSFPIQNRSGCVSVDHFHSLA